MSITKALRGSFLLFLFLAGCDQDSLSRKEALSGKAEAAPTAKPAPATKAPVAPTRKEMAKNVIFETLEGDRRRVLVQATVCLREGQLELLMTKKRTKEHEAILAADVDARMIHAALLLTGAKVGSPVRYIEKNGKYSVVPPTGSKIKITLEYQEKGKTVTVPAHEWVRNARTKKDLDAEWVFAGSQLVYDQEDKKKPPLYAANGGDVICLSNFESALLDVPFNSSKENADLLFEVHTERVPALETKVTVILEPVTEKKK